MIDWIKNEIRCFKKSRTIKWAYAKKAFAAIVGITITFLPVFRSYLTPELFIALTTLFAIVDNKLRKVTKDVL